ncbi:prolyl oligopeptidase family serine peptidase [Deefgea piscis]|uniref:prolyl oligopeptidase family serine peptidase n=1 Tax=Deefgea piscis TaxID=2739061 RepID=UPI001C803960|nr:prolyl oligopeptidase family serine peptidase [Deefgea piscis]QZA79834.1 prolyl oligopeptidase family serine peptidase [Deefgea piscis]
MPHSDPFVFLENHDQAQSWIAAQNLRTRNALDTDPRFAIMTEQILQFSQDQQQIPYFAQHGDWLYHFYQGSTQPRGVYRRTTLASYQSTDPQWQIVFDLDQLAEIEEVKWQLAGISHCILQANLCLISLSINGSDGHVCREYDIEQQCFVENGFRFPFGKNVIHWRDANSVFVAPAWDESQLTQAGLPCEVWLLQRGQAWDDADNLVVLPETALRAQAWRFLDGDRTVFDVIEAAHSLDQKAYYHLDDALQLQHLPLPLRCEILAYSQGDLIVKLASNWSRQGQVYPVGALLAVACDAKTAQFGRIELLIAPTAQQSIQTIEATLNGLVVAMLDCVKSRVHGFVWQQGEWQQQPNLLPEGGVIEFVDQPWQTDILYFNYSDFLHPATLYRYDLLGQQAPEMLRQQVAAFDSQHFIQQQRFASAKDGTLIPYFIVHHQSLALDGQTPTILYGYGGFAQSLLPYYVDNLGPQWLAKGGAFVVANIRGGGEFGPAWHQAAQGAGRQVSFDDFIAIAEDLMVKGYTSAAKLAIQGGSHGGLLVGACLTQRPELFEAVVCEAPLLDMLRYTELGAGASWLSEYGDPKIPDQHAVLAAYSPYQHIASAATSRYPKILLSCASSDDRVHPAHARKMAAKLAAAGHEVLFFEKAHGGHQTGQNATETAKELARTLVFLQQRLMD